MDEYRRDGRSGGSHEDRSETSVLLAIGWEEGGGEGEVVGWESGDERVYRLPERKGPAMS